MAAVNEVWEVTTQQLLWGQTLINTAALKLTQVPAGMTDEQLFDKLTGPPNDGYITTLAHLLSEMQSNQLTHVRLTAQRVIPAGGVVFIKQVAIAGAQPGNPKFTNTALCISRRGNGPGRRKYGRIAVGGLPDNYAENGRWNVNMLGMASAVANKLIGQWFSQDQTVGALVGFFSPPRPWLPVPPEGLFIHCLSAVPRDTTRVQRSRTVNVGI